MTKQRFNTAFTFLNESVKELQSGKHKFEKFQEPSSVAKILKNAKVFFWQEKAMKHALQTDNARETVGLLNSDEMSSVLDQYLSTIHFFDTPPDWIVANTKGAKIIAIFQCCSGLVGHLCATDWKGWDEMSKNCEISIYWAFGSEKDPDFTPILTSCLSLLHFAKQPAETVSTVSRIETKEKGKGQTKKNDINVVVLRRPQRDENHTPMPTGKHFTITCEFDVAPFTRRQWYPSEGIHRTIPIASFTKGKGLPRKPTIYKVVDR